MPNEKQTLSSQIHDAILEMIIDSGAASEDMLLTESDLVERFQVSKSPVREALLKLCGEEVLKSIPRCGYVVVRLGEKNGRDNQQVRAMLELSSMEAHFEAFTPAYLQHLQAHLQSARDTMREEADIWRVWQCNMDFHGLLIAVSGNPYLVKHLSECINVEKRYYAQNHWNNTKRFQVLFNPTAHESIYQAIADGDKALTLALLRKDIRVHDE